MNMEGTPLVMPVSPSNSNGSGVLGSFLSGESIWIVVLFFIMVLFLGRGNNNGNGGGGVAPNYVLSSDFSNIERKIDGVNQGLCDGFYAMNTGMLNGFAGVNQTISNGFSAAEVARCNAQMTFMQQFFALQQQIAECCCNNREAISQVRYDMATQDCATRNQIQTSTRDIIDALNCGLRGIDQRLTNQELAAKDARIAEQDRQLFLASLGRSQATQSNELMSYVAAQFARYNPQPVPAYDVPAPYPYCRQSTSSDSTTAA